MASVHLDFVAPDEDNLVSLHIWEGPTKDGPFNPIETVTAIGDFPNYISEYTTNLAVSKTNWFTIFWTDDKGATTDFSAPIQGETTTLVAEVKDRVMQRNPSIDERLAVQSAEAVITYVLGVSDPYDPTLTATYRQLEGMTLLTMAYASIFTLVGGGSSESYTVGLVSQKSSEGGSGNRETIDWLIKQANKLLGLSISYVMLLEDIDPTGLGTVGAIQSDVSRGALTVNFD